MGRQTHVTLPHTGGLCQTSCKATMDHYTSCYTDKSNPDQTIHQLNISLCWLELQFRHRAFGRINPICNFPFIYLWVEQTHLQYTERHIQIFRLLDSKHWPFLSEGEVKEGKHTNRRDRKCEPRPLNIIDLLSVSQPNNGRALTRQNTIHVHFDLEQPNHTFCGAHRVASVE